MGLLFRLFAANLHPINAPMRMRRGIPTPMPMPSPTFVDELRPPEFESETVAAVVEAAAGAGLERDKVGVFVAVVEVEVVAEVVLVAGSERLK